MNQQQTPRAWDADDNKPVIPRIPRPRPASAELDTAIRVAQEMFAAYGDSRRDGFSYAEAYGALRESLRLVLRALDAEPDTEEGSALVRTLGGDQRCPAAHCEDPDPCTGPVVVTVLDKTNAGLDGCEHHGARLLASLDRGYVIALPDAPAGTASRVFKAADSVRPYPWVNGPRTRPGQLSRAEVHERGERP